MAITATFDTVQRTALPLAFDFGVTYTDSDNVNWHLNKIIRITVDPALTGPQRRAAIVQQVRDDAATYAQLESIYAGVVSLVGQTIVVAP